MELKNSFEVEAPVEEVWRALTDFERVVSCVPGAELLEPPTEARCSARMTIKLGPMTLKYQGDIDVLEKDAAAHRAVLQGKARAAGGQGNVRAKVTLQLAGDGTRTRAEVDSDVQIGGRAAALGQGVIKDVAAKLTNQFADNLAGLFATVQTSESEKSAPPRAEALRAGSLAGAILRERVTRPWAIGAALLTLLAVVYTCG